MKCKVSGEISAGFAGVRENINIVLSVFNGEITDFDWGHML